MKIDKFLTCQRPIYFPVYAGGVVTFMDKYNHHYDLMREKYRNFPKSFRIWVEGEPDQYFYYPYALFSSFHFPNINVNERYFMDRESMLVFGDSGGYQVSTAKAGAKWTKEKALAWAEKNASITPILDTPISTPGITLDKAIAQSLDAARFMEENRDRSIPLKVLNVVSGTRMSIIRPWIDALSRYEFDGWAHGGKISLVSEYILPLAYLIAKGVYTTDMTPKIHHMLGVGNPSAFVFLSYMQKCLTQLGYPIQLTFDSSTASSYIKTATYIMSIGLEGTRKYSLSKLDGDLRDRMKTLQAQGIMLGCDCPVCTSVTEIGDITDETNFVDYYLFYWMHNVYMQVRFKNHIDFVIDTENDRIYKETFGATTIKAFDTIRKILENPKAAMNDPGLHLVKELEEYAHEVVNTGRKASKVIQGTSLTDFFA